ncbi:MAG: tryptophan halogenase [Proteobacteria bacterium]|nr:MAG: tryptophan halogenase [Pseudomonadota bacterium]
MQKLVIAGGGTAGWLAAAALAQQFRGILDVTLIESDEIGTVGVGESTIPTIRGFHRLLGIDEQAFMRATSATFKLGIHFENWKLPQHRYAHAFGRVGLSTWICGFHHFWLHSLTRGMCSELEDYCVERLASKQHKFATSPDSEINYAYHLDAGVYAKFLRKMSEHDGARRIEGKITEVRQHPDTGFIESLVLDSGQVVEGDFFIDCTGFRGLLIEQTLQSGFEDWSHWLPCDRAVAVQTESVGPAVPYTLSAAHEAGWRWRIPLQHRVGNGLVYCSRYMSDEEATGKLLREVQGRTLTQPRVIRFRAGRRRCTWNKNVVALGLASGFLEPLESTSIHLIMSGITRLMQLFPFGGVQPCLVEHYNRATRTELESIRDFIVLHYHATEREDTPFWRHVRSMAIPESLAHRLEMFRSCAHVWQHEGELFRTDSWLQVMLGQGVQPRRYHHYARAMSDHDLERLLTGLRRSVAETVRELPSHQEFLDRYCRATEILDAS